MAPAPSTPRRPQGARPRGRPKTSASTSRVRKADPDAVAAASEPPPKKRKYVPGGPGGGGRFVDENGGGGGETETPAEPLTIGAVGTTAKTKASSIATTTTAAAATIPRRRLSRPRAEASPAAFPTRERSTRVRHPVNRHDDDSSLQYSSAAAVAAAVVQSEGYKPREERGWEEFHPNLDVEATFMVFDADTVDGTAKEFPPVPATVVQVPGLSVNGDMTPAKDPNAGPTDSAKCTPTEQGNTSTLAPGQETPSRRRGGRPSRDSVSLYATRHSEVGKTPKTPKVLPIHNQTAKERLDLKLPSYRKTNRILLYESKTFGQARYVDKAMMNVGYQESDVFIRPDRKLIKSTDANLEEDFDASGAAKGDGGDPVQHTAGVVGRVEYDMDEQDDMWLETLNAQRKAADMDPITREAFEITITKIEKEWHALEKRIPKPNPKPPQTHRPRSSSAAAVNGETNAGEEQDSKCAICDDGDCENTNAIVFCDGCDLAVHQECYGVPFIPEGQWLCRKCQLIGRGIPTCIFCPNTDGAFKQTNSSKWAHLLCAMWIPEVSLGNHTFMEPVMEVEKVPRTRWKLTCYICDQRMGACIQCSNKNCYQAFHVTCARRCRLYLKMKNSQGALAVLDGTLPLKAYCDKHCPEEYAKENDVDQATREAKRLYKRTMKGRIWADSQASAIQIAATHRHAITEHPPDESQKAGAKLSAVLGDKKKGQAGKPIWKLPSGAPIIPQAVYDIVESALQRLPIRKRKDYVAEACRYWTLKREARRGAALLKRLQLQMETFSSMELTRRDFAAMGPSGRARLQRRIEFARNLLKDLAQLRSLAEHLVEREVAKLEEAEMQQEFVDTCYFPIFKMLVPIIEKAIVLDKDIFREGLLHLQGQLDKRFYTTTLQFAHDLCEVINVGINKEDKPGSPADEVKSQDVGEVTGSRHPLAQYTEARDRKRLGKRILKSVQPQLEAALKAESDISGKALQVLHKELEGMVEASLEVRHAGSAASQEDEGGLAGEASQDTEMADSNAQAEAQAIGPDAGGEDAETQSPANTSASQRAEPADAMQVDAASPERHEMPANAKANPAPSKEAETAVMTNGGLSSTASVNGDKNGAATTKSGSASDVFKDVGTPPSLAGAPFAISAPHSTAATGSHVHLLPLGPLTPPQSNGSLDVGGGVGGGGGGGGSSGSGTQASPTHFTLSEGGVPWYLKGFKLEGTSAVEEQWTGRQAVRSLSEELTDMDDDALKDLAFDVDDESAAVAGGTNGAAVGGAASAMMDVDGDEGDENEDYGGRGGGEHGDGDASRVPNGHSGKATTASAPMSTRKRSNPARFRKGVRSSTRRR